MSITKISPDVVDFDSTLTLTAADTDTVDSVSNAHLVLTDDGDTAYWKVRMGTTNRYLGIDGLDSSTWKEVITFDRTEQRVGIGTSDPTERLEVYSTQATTAIEVSAGQASTTTGEAKIVLRSLHSASGTTYSRSEIASLGVAGGDSALIFRTTTDSNGPQERMRILDSGGLTFNGDTATANALDDYEEGTYTVTGYDASSGGNASSTTITGTYTKIGRQVTVQFYSWNNISTSGMTSGNIFYFTLPFTGSAVRAIGSAAHHGFTYDGNTNMQDIKPLAAGSSGRGYFKTVGYGQADSTVKVSDITSGTDDIHTFTLTYTV